jgi:DNA-binding NarL/FixJ family response regulator
MRARPIRVLSVEDNEFVADALARKLAGDPDFHWMGWVRSIEELDGKGRGAEGPPDVVCMDLDMPGQDAYQMIRFLQHAYPDCRVLMLTGHVDVDNIDKAIDAGAWGYLSKAEESRTIVDSIRRVADGHFVLGQLCQTEYKVQTADRTPVKSGKKRWGWFRLM